MKGINARYQTAVRALSEVLAHYLAVDDWMFLNVELLDAGLVLLDAYEANIPIPSSQVEWLSRNRARLEAWRRNSA